MQKSKNTLLGRIVLLLGVLPLAFVLSSCSKSETVTFQAQTDDGIFDSSQFKGDVIYVDFWASWCKDCWCYSRSGSDSGKTICRRI